MLEKMTREVNLQLARAFYVTCSVLAMKMNCEKFNI